MARRVLVVRPRHLRDVVEPAPRDRWQRRRFSAGVVLACIVGALACVALSHLVQR
jgi:hypothetical protein